MDEARLPDLPSPDDGRAGSIVRIGNDAFGNVVVSGHNNVVTLTFIVSDPRLLDGLGARPDSSAPVANPYLGLRAFRETEASWFFGRTRLVRRAWVQFRALQQGTGPRILAVVGASGSGKSSLVRAGLLTELAREPVEGLEALRVLLMRPGKAPLTGLAEALSRLPGLPAGDAAQMQQVPDGACSILHRLVSGLLDSGSSRLVIVVDQFEELFTECTDTADRAAFLGNLAYAASHEDRLVSVVLTLRSDFAAAVQAPAVFARAVREPATRLVVQAMTRDELTEAVARPARALGRPWPPALAEYFVAQAEGRAGALPLLQFALQRLWPDHAAGRLAETGWDTCLIEDYLVETADHLYEVTGEPAERTRNQRVLRRAFLAMVQFGEGTPDTRRVARLPEIVGHQESPQDVLGILRPFTVEKRWLVMASEQDGEPAFELSHEVLISAWTRLRMWLGHLPGAEESGELRADLRLHRRLSSATMAWRAGWGGLAQPPELAAILAYRARAASDLTRDEVAFIQESDRESRRAVLRQKRTRWGFGGLGAVLLATVLLAVILYARQVYYQTEALARDARLLAVSSVRQTASGDGMTGMLLALRALGIGDGRVVQGQPRAPRTQEAEQALYTALNDNRELRQIQHPGDKETVMAVAFSPDGKQLATGSSDGHLRLWDPLTGAAELDIDALAGPIGQVRFPFRDSQRVLAVPARGPAATLWDVGKRSEVGSLEVRGETIKRAGFSPDGRHILIATAGGAAGLLESETARRGQVYAVPNAVAVVAAAVGEGGKPVLLLTEDGTAWRVDGEAGQHLIDPSGRIMAAAFAPGATRVVTVSEDGDIRVWPDAPVEARIPPPIGNVLASVRPGVAIREVTFSPGRQHFAVSFDDRTMRIWETASGRMVALPLVETEGQIDTAVFSDDDQLLATLASAKETIATAPAPRPARIWRLSDGHLVATLRGHSLAIRAMAFNPEGTRLATAVRIWDVRASRSIVRTGGYRGGLLEAAQHLPPEQARIAIGLEDQPISFAGGRALVAAAQDGGVLVADAGPGGARAIPAAQDSLVSALATNPVRTDEVLVGRFNGRLDRLDLRGSQTASVPEGHAAPVSSVAYSRDGSVFISGSWDHTAQVHDAGDGRLKLPPFDHAGPVLSVALSPDARLAVTAADDGLARIWDMTDGRLLKKLEHGHQKVGFAVFSATGDRVLTTAWDGVARIWDVGPEALHAAGAGSPPASFVHVGVLRSAEFDQTGRVLLTVCVDGAARLWRVGTGQEPRILRQANGAAILAAGFIPETPGAGEDPADVRVVTAAEDGTVDVWAGATRLAGLGSHMGPVTAIAFDPAGRHLATASADHELQVWSLLPSGQALIDLAISRRTRELTPEQRAQFFPLPTDRHDP